MELTQAMIDEDWVVAVHSQTDTCDFMTPDDLGRFDALLGLPCQPLEYFAKLGDIELYEQAWRETIASLDLVEAREDEEFWRGGAW